MTLLTRLLTALALTLIAACASAQSAPGPGLTLIGTVAAANPCANTPLNAPLPSAAPAYNRMKHIRQTAVCRDVAPSSDRASSPRD